MQKPKNRRKQKSNRSKKPKVTIEYDGMGTCVEAAIYAGDALICVVHTHNPAMNRLTMRAANAVKRSLERAK